MSSLVKFTPLCGARSEEPLCYLLEIDEACILLDCGWDENFDVVSLRKLIKIAPTLDAILLTHCDLGHLGALPYIIRNCNVKAKVYATIPVQKMGQLTMYDMVESRMAKEDFKQFTLADIDMAWDNFVVLRYQQSCSLSGKAEGITISPLNAGHMIGGALWKITKESEEIVYAVDYNHAQDRHLDGTVLVDLPRPNILITDAYTALDKNTLGGKKAREQRLIEHVMSAIRQDGNVLIPVDSTGRVLELLIVLDELWQQNPHLRGVTLAFLSPESRSIIDMAMSQTEWLSKHVNQRFIQSRHNVFHLENVHRCCSREELGRLPYPQVVLASGLDLETSSFSLDLFAEWAPDSKNLVLLTQKARPGSRARQFQDLMGSGLPLPSNLMLQMHRRVPLEGRELREHEEQERLKALEARRQLEEEAEEAEEEEEEEEENAGAVGEAKEGEEVGKKASTPRAGKGADWSGSTPNKRHKKGRGGESRFLMFPHHEEIYSFDEYGEVMDTSIYLKEDQQEEVQGFVEETISYSGSATSELRPVAHQLHAAAAIPTKSLTYTIRTQLNCGMAFLDYGGRSDSSSVHTILEHLKPAKVIVIHGSEKATEELQNFCIRKVTEPENTFAPPVGEAVMASSDTNIYKIKLDKALAQGLQFVRVGGYDVAYIDASITCPDENSVDNSSTLPVGQNKDKQMPTLVPRQQEDGGGRKPFAFIGDVKLSDLKVLLEKQKYKTELKAGMLVVNGSIIIRKSGSRMIFEGTICTEYAAVRSLLMSQYHTL
ncbi:hypothetical protein GUITHDRAFT_89302 [Guillardia theta CCMP2712]|uniref:Cleavage and polyadenylation specificity factor subunit 2 n=1 Tax=Guillardia theta (strain CCMP2712) TaxID=905079 RepID=L1IRY3_GUITC|nr:hypothetical protein GUITHDRAFT_89302 [Guillardia theta CCMP2712]EKX38664.1 hypothetical protein GUITHDRAFT_89302 [Guillardia theta CCMP2712]|eukprot:XP_005825644.1 hypothetical protein GUITHDRAFT_89302 [Guillardia theta CCMP2712]